jgi:hypothetical protein
MVNPIYGKEVFAWVFDDATGEHGIAGFRTPDGQWHPMVCAVRDRAIGMRPLAERISAEIGVPIQLLHYTLTDVVETFAPGAANSASGRAAETPDDRK